ncbi:hypothetical protein SXIM_00260 [Streptomyces xiamenensis]|uniref:DUF4352 domain-containing protein n=1 Tax=Streptomyces xiamenensis TaxID=408015 RepID=A0A0F7FNW6_9ACTN|nr:hypothetical protein [Streptomyces xiamenensis]AKG41410.1 hypothetical protein SXIM_00260 [Streptomyces xiamenensis]
MNARFHRAGIAAAAVAGLALTGCSSSDDNGNARPPLSQNETPAGDDASPDGDDVQDDDADPQTQASGDLAPGESYTWESSGLSVTIDRIEELDPSTLEEWDRPKEGRTPFRVHLTVANTGQQPVDLGSLSLNVEGATNGGEVFVGMYSGDVEITGRLAPGVTAEKSQSWSLDTEAYGRDILVTASYWGDEEDIDLWTEDPQWVGTME